MGKEVIHRTLYSRNGYAKAQAGLAGLGWGEGGPGQQGWCAQQVSSSLSPITKLFLVRPCEHVTLVDCNTWQLGSELPIIPSHNTNCVAADVHPIRFLPVQYDAWEAVTLLRSQSAVQPD